MKTIIAILAILILAIVAITQGIDGWILALAMAAISGLGGFALKKLPWGK